MVLSKRSYHDALLTAIETGRVTLGELNLDLEQRRALLTRDLSLAELLETAGGWRALERSSPLDGWCSRLGGPPTARRLP